MVCSNKREDCLLKGMKVKRERKPNGYWDILDHCLEEAKKYSTRQELHDAKSNCHAHIMKHGWDTICFAHMEQRYENWNNLEKCKNEAEKYNSVSELKTNCQPCFRSIKKHKWQSICFAGYKGYISTKQTQSGYWQNLKHCQEMALKFETVKKLYKVAPGCVLSIRKHNWEESCYKHMPSFWGKKTSRSANYDSINICLAEALKYKSKSELHEANRTCHKTIIKNGWQNVCFAHMKKESKQPGFWDKLEHCIEECNKYKNYADLSKASSPCVDAIKRHEWESICYKKYTDYTPWKFQKKDFLNLKANYKSILQLYERDPELFTRLYYSHWYDEVNKNMQEQTLLSKEQIEMLVFSYCKKVAKEFKMRFSFQEGNHYAYQIAKKNGWLNEICMHMHVTGNLKLRCIYAATFNDHSAYIGLSGNYEQRIRHHINNPKSTVYKYMKKTGLKPGFNLIHNYTNVEEARRLEGIYLMDYKRAGWNILNVADTGCLGGSTQISDEEILEIAMEYNTLTQFIKEKYNLYQMALRRKKLLKEIKRILPSVKHEKYTKEDVLTVARNCVDAREFRLLHSGAYNVAIKNGYLDEICAMLPKGTSIKINTIEDAIELTKTCSKMAELRYKSESAATLLRKYKPSFSFKSINDNTETLKGKKEK